MTKIVDAFKFAWNLLREGYDTAVALIADWPHAAFWLIVLLMVAVAA